MNKSTASYKSFITISTEDKKTKSKEINKNDLNEILINFKKNLNNNLFTLKEVTKKNIEENKENIFKIDYKKIESIIKEIESLFNKYINNIKDFYRNEYENLLRYNEQKIRILHEYIFNLELKRKILEESNFNLLRKEKEYNLIKAKTGIIVQNGKIIDNNRKENEILILKKENSILKDTIERQRIDILIKKRKIQQKNALLNTKLILKLNLKNKNNKKILKHHSHPKSNPHFKPNIISKYSNSIMKYKSIISKKSFHNNSFTKLFNTDNNSIAHNSSKKNKNIKNYVNIKVRGQGGKNSTKYSNKEIKKNMNNIHKNFNNKEKLPIIKNRYFSECLKNKKINLLIIKTLNNENNGYKKKRFLSPVNVNIKQKNNLIPKGNNPINEIKYSQSFTSKNNINNLNMKNIKLDSEEIQKKSIKRIIISKIENNKIKKINLINKRKNESNSNYKSRKYKSTNNSKKKINNNINIINYTSINNFINKNKSLYKK